MKISPDRLESDKEPSFGTFLQTLRKKRNLSSSSLARAAGMNQSHLNRIERGLRNPPARESVIKLSIALGLEQATTDELLLRAGYAPADLSGLAKMNRQSFATEPSPEAKMLIQSVATEMIALVDGPLKPQERQFFLKVLGALPSYIRSLRANATKD